jgi:hypothetical protein
MDAISPIMEALAMTQFVTDAVSQVIKRYSNSSDVVRHYHSFIVPLTQSLPPSTKHPDLSPPTVGLGKLDLFPIEIIQEICLRLNLYSLTRLKSVNRYMSAIVDAIPQYQIISRQPPRVLQGIGFMLGRGKGVSCQMVYEKLSNEACETCGGDGTHLSLVKFKRVCLCV